MQSLSLVMSECSLSARGQGHVSNFYMVDFKKFRHSISIVEACYQLSSRKLDAQSVINWAVVGQLSL